jgi:hypothetical protein
MMRMPSRQFLVVAGVLLALALAACAADPAPESAAPAVADDAGAATDAAPAPEVDSEMPAEGGMPAAEPDLDDAGSADALPPQVDGDDAPSTIAVGEPNPGAPGAVDTSCKTDADCAIKDVGSCCGYRPACVNTASPTFPEQVQAQCAKDGRMGICGFPAITGCTCNAGRCEGTGSDIEQVH